jgi:hypothetical protein
MSQHDRFGAAERRAGEHPHCPVQLCPHATFSWARHHYTPISFWRPGCSPPGGCPDARTTSPRPPLAASAGANLSSYSAPCVLRGAEWLTDQSGAISSRPMSSGPARRRLFIAGRFPDRRRHRGVISGSTVIRLSRSLAHHARQSLPIMSAGRNSPLSID